MCSDIMHILHGMHTQASWPPYVYVACQELLMDVPFAQAEQYLSKLTASHFGTLNTKFATRMCWKGFSLLCTMRTRPIAMRTSGYVLKSKSGKVRRTDCRAEIQLGMCVESHLDKPLDSERDFTMWIGSQKEI